ncbi:DUF456 domain-containing protein [Flavobacterium urocaniciphilum]|uniref:DUF456 domain-containing protein n=1 Tax=Flavobacterium urocaniciphilum TaxID=1299341 RepID=A0A1H9AFY0_9FLAO|nr:DUF456 domain-containing protein [Flavobacterium urocaniciphilum]SEP75421.1 hypothetical protein SAMN05444005_102124 [Flavobacterium urocaniciphilum]
MEYILLILGICLIFGGIIGSILPALPGLPVSWLGLLCLFFVPGIETNYWLLGITLLITIVLSVLDYLIPAKGTKMFGGTSYGIWGTNIGLVVGLFFPPLGFLICPFLGAFIGELMYNSQDKKRAFNAAFGSFIGFLAGTFMKVFYGFILLGIFIWITAKNYSIWI